jgi:hypothetical protein
LRRSFRRGAGSIREFLTPVVGLPEVLYFYSADSNTTRYRREGKLLNYCCNACFRLGFTPTAAILELSQPPPSALTSNTEVTKRCPCSSLQALVVGQRPVFILTELAVAKKLPSGILRKGIERLRWPPRHW